MLAQVEGAIDTVFNTKGGELTGIRQIGVDLFEDDQAVVRLSPTKCTVRPQTPRLRHPSGEGALPLIRRAGYAALAA